MELGRHASGLGTWRCRGLEVRCRSVDLEAKRYGDRELGRCAAGVADVEA